MTYNEWRDELKSNLLCVSDGERRRVLDYYAEAYADRREAGFSEREIIEDFGAPYDAAQRILSENRNGGYREDVNAAQSEPHEKTRSERRREERMWRRENDRANDRQYDRMNGSANDGETRYAPPPPPPPQPAPAYAYANNAPAAARPDNTWVFVLLCIIFAVPLFGLIMAMVGITIGFCVAPIAIIGTGAAAIGTSIGTMIGGSVAYGLFSMGMGVLILGVGIALCPLFFKLVGLMWSLFQKCFSWLKSLFSGKERV